MLKLAPRLAMTAVSSKSGNRMNCSAAGKAEASPKIREAETAKVLSTEGIVKFRNCLPLEEAEMIVDKNIKRGIVEENTEEAVEKTLGD